MAEVKERPIIFSGPMVRAILAGRKTQTRRILRNIPEWAERVTSINDDLFQVWNTAGDGMNFIRSSYGRPGDRLWVRETWGTLIGLDTANGVEFDEYEDKIQKEHQVISTVFRADGFEPCSTSFWRPSIHMPRWASRITLEIVSVRVERLQDITETDAQAEGVGGIFDDWAGPGNKSYRRPFANLWNAINSKRGYSWESNPFVWVLSFKVITPANNAMQATRLRVASASA